MPDRFVPLGQMPQGGGSLPSTGNSASRFVPISRVGASGGGGSGLNIPGLFNQFQNLGQGSGVGSGIAKGAGMLGSALGGINTAGRAWAGLSGGANPIPSGVGTGLGVASGLLGLGSGLYGLSQGQYAGIPGLVSGGLGFG